MYIGRFLLRKSYSFVYFLRSINWLNNEILSVNHEIKLVKDRILIINKSREKRPKVQETIVDKPKNVSSSKPNVLPTIFTNQQNIYIIKLLADEPMFQEYLQNLTDIYKISLTATIECIAVFTEENSKQKYVFIKLSNGTTDTYQMSESKLLKENHWNNTQPISLWFNQGRKIEYYRRFVPDNKINKTVKHDLIRRIRSE